MRNVPMTPVGSVTSTTTSRLRRSNVCRSMVGCSHQSTSPACSAAAAVDGSGTINVTGRPGLWTAFKQIGSVQNPEATVTADGVRALGSAAFWPGLRSLDLGGAFDTNPAWDHTYPCLDRDGLEILLTILPASSVDELRLSHNNLDDTDIALLVAAPGVAQLRLLDLGDTGLTDAGAASLIAAPTLARLTTLKLWTHNLGEEKKRALHQRFGNAL